MCAWGWAAAGSGPPAALTTGGGHCTIGLPSVSSSHSALSTRALLAVAWWPAAALPAQPHYALQTPFLAFPDPFSRSLRMWAGAPPHGAAGVKCKKFRGNPMRKPPLSTPNRGVAEE